MMKQTEASCKREKTLMDEPKAEGKEKPAAHGCFLGNRLIDNSFKEANNVDGLYWYCVQAMG